MRDHADHPFPVREAFQRGRDHFEGVRVERAETFVEEDGIQPGRAGSGQGGHMRGQGQRQRQTRLERLPAGQSPHRAFRVGVGVVDDVELAFVVGEVELSPGQFHQACGSVHDQCVQRGGCQPPLETVSAQQIAEQFRDLLLLLGLVPVAGKAGGTVAALTDLLGRGASPLQGSGDHRQCLPSQLAVRDVQAVVAHLVGQLRTDLPAGLPGVIDLGCCAGERG